MKRISLLISIYKGFEFLEGFSKNLKSQTIFDEIEPIFICCNKIGSEDYEELDKFLKKEFSKQISDGSVKIETPGECGLYSAWNIGISKASCEIIGNWNIDDRRTEDSLEMQVGFMEMNPHVDLCYGQAELSQKANELPSCSPQREVFPCLDFSVKNLLMVNSPHCFPVWRKDIHDKFGLFDENFFSAGDYDMWLRAATGGSIFQKLYFTVGSYYENPNSISRNKQNYLRAVGEVNKVRKKYLEIYESRK